MKTRRTAAAVLVAFLTATTPTLPAFAQQDDAVTLQARARFKEGVDFFDKGQFENARLAFLQAYALKKHPAVLLNLAQSSAKAGHPLEASKYFQQYLREATATPEQKKAAEEGLAEVRQKLGHIEIVAPAGTEVSLDDAKIGTAPFNDPVDVEVGPHTLKSSTETVKVIAVVGQKTQAKFGGASGAPAAAGGAAPATTSPGAAAAETKPEAKAEGGGETTEPPNKDYGKEKPGLFAPPEKMAPVYVGVAVGVVGLAGTITFAIFKNNAQTSADQVAGQIKTAATQRHISSQGICNSPPTEFVNACNTLKDNNKKVDTDATLANVSIGVMAAGFVFAAGWYLFAPKKDANKANATGLVVTPYAGYGNAGAVLDYTF